MAFFRSPHAYFILAAICLTITLTSWWSTDIEVVAVPSQASAEATFIDRSESSGSELVSVSSTDSDIGDVPRHLPHSEFSSARSHVHIEQLDPNGPFISPETTHRSTEEVLQAVSSSTKSELTPVSFEESASPEIPRVVWLAGTIEAVGSAR